MLLFALVGPLAGGLVFIALLAVWMGQGSDAAGIAALFAFMTIYGLFLSWFIGAAPAVLTGLAFAFWQTFVGRVPWPMAALVGLAAGFVLTVAGGEAFVPGPGDPPMLPLNLLTCLVATMVCWTLARSFVTAGERRMN